MNPDAGVILADHVLAAQAGSLPEASRKRGQRSALPGRGHARQRYRLPTRARARHAPGRSGPAPAGHVPHLPDVGARFLGDEISIKPFACCKYGHNAITAVLILRNDPDLSVRSVDELIVRVGADTWDIICDPLELKASPDRLAGPDGLALAQFSLPFMVSTALLRGRLSAAELDQDWRANPELAAMLGRVRIVRSDETFSADMIPEPGRVEIVLADGRRRSAEATRTPGHPDHPLDEAALRAKFLSCARRLGPARSQDLLDAIAQLDELDDVAQIARLTVSS